MLGTYGDVLSRPGAALFSFTAMISRFPLSMAGLGLVLVVSERTGSYGQAGTVAAAYVLSAAALGPTQGRLADRLGQTPVLLVVGALYAVGLALTLVAIDGDWSTPWVHVCAAFAGAATPQTGSMVRARWTHVVKDRGQLNTAFAIEAVLDEVVFVVGPVVVTFLTIQVSDYAGLAVAGAAATLGSWALGSTEGHCPAGIGAHVDHPRSAVVEPARPGRVRLSRSRRAVRISRSHRRRVLDGRRPARRVRRRARHLGRRQPAGRSRGRRAPEHA